MPENCRSLSDRSGCAEHGRPDCDDCFMDVCGGSEYARPDDPIVFGNRWREALLEIVRADPVDLILDPTWSQRIAREALGELAVGTDDSQGTEGDPS